MTSIQIQHHCVMIRAMCLWYTTGNYISKVICIYTTDYVMWRSDKTHSFYTTIYAIHNHFEYDEMLSAFVLHL